MKFFIEPFRLIWRHRWILKQTVATDLRIRYAGLALGLSWMFFYPLLFLGVYALVYNYIFRVGSESIGTGMAYVLFIFCGLVPFLGFAESVTGGTSSIITNSKLIRNTLFPVELLPVKAVLVAQGTQVVGTVLLLVALGIAGRLTPWALLLPVLWLLQLMLTIGIAWILSSSCVLLRDLQHAVSLMLLMLMMLSPIAYTADMVPPLLGRLLWLNPLYPIIVSYQDALFKGQCPHVGVLALLLGLACVLFCGGLAYFHRLKRVFVENV